LNTKPSLEDPAVVDALVRQFAARVFDIRAAWHRGEPGVREALLLIEADARRMGNIFLGRDPAYDASDWHRKTLQWTLAVLLPEHSKQYGDPGAALFMWLAAQLAAGAAVLEEDASAEAEADVKRKLERVTDDVKAHLRPAEPATTGS